MALRDIDISRADFALEYTRFANKLTWCQIGVLLVLTACTPAPPQYESRVAPIPASTTQTVTPVPAAPVSIPIDATFIDEFDRAGTAGGLGNDWELRGAPTDDSPLPPSTDGYVANGHFTYDGKSDVIAVRRFRGVVRAIGAEGQFRRRNDSKGETSMSIGIAGDSNAADNVVLFLADRNSWEVKSRLSNGKLKTIAVGGFAPPLDRDHVYRFVLSSTGEHVNVAGPGISVSKPLTVPIAPGSFGFWREYPVKTPAGEVFDFDKVWALEDGQPAVSTAAPSSEAGHP